MMRESKFFCNLLFLFVIIFLGASAASAQRNVISGFVFDESRRPVSQIYVELQNEFYTIIGRQRTVGSGMFNFNNLPGGQYYVKVQTAGTNYQEQIKEVVLSNIPGARIASEHLDIYLKIKKSRAESSSAPSGVVFAQEVPAEAKKLYEEGLADLAEKKEEGLTKIKRSIEVFPDYFAALDRLGVEYLTRGYYEPAFVLFTKALTINARSPSSAFGVGVAAFRLGQTAKALDHFLEAIKLDKGSVDAHLWAGIAYHQKGDFSAALKSLLEADKLSNSKSSEVHWQLARVYKDLKKFTQAAKELEEFLRLRPDVQDADAIKNVIASLRKKT